MKKKKLKLNDLRIKSFITQTDEETSKTIKAGVGDTTGEPLRPIKNPLDTALCAPTPGTWCYHCPVVY